MLGLVISLLIIALIAAALGFGGIAVGLNSGKCGRSPISDGLGSDGAGTEAIHLNCVGLFRARTALAEILVLRHQLRQRLALATLIAWCLPGSIA